MEWLVEANLREHQEQLRLDDGTVSRYQDVGAEVLICAGTKSPGPGAMHQRLLGVKVDRYPCRTDGFGPFPGSQPETTRRTMSIQRALGSETCRPFRRRH
jgi:hypothetical protein